MIQIDLRFYRKYFEQEKETSGVNREVKNLEYESKELRAGRTRGRTNEITEVLCEIKNASPMEMVFLCNTKTDTEEPISFDQAWNHPEKDQQEKWREAIKKELLEMLVIINAVK